MNPRTKKKTRAQKIREADARVLRAARRFTAGWMLVCGHRCSHPDCDLYRAIEARLKLEKGKG